MTREQMEIYRQFCIAFNIRIQTLGLAFIVANDAFNSISLGVQATKEHGALVKKEIETIANLMK